MAATAFRLYFGQASPASVVGRIPPVEEGAEDAEEHGEKSRAGPVKQIGVIHTAWKEADDEHIPRADADEGVDGVRGRECEPFDWLAALHWGRFTPPICALRRL